MFLKRQNDDKIYDYKILDDRFSIIGQGKCKILGTKYSMIYDCIIYKIIDIDTNKKIEVKYHRLILS